MARKKPRIQLPKRPVQDPQEEGRVFCESPGCPLCRPGAPLSRMVRVSLPWRPFHRLLGKGVASFLVRRLILAELHRPAGRTRRGAPAAGPRVALRVNVTEAVHEELARRGRLVRVPDAGRELAREFLENKGIWL